MFSASSVIFKKSLILLEFLPEFLKPAFVFHFSVTLEDRFELSVELLLFFVGRFFIAKPERGLHDDWTAVSRRDDRNTVKMQAEFFRFRSKNFTQPRVFFERMIF